jgi:hypothetical protein
MQWEALDGTRWEGTSELWEDPLGNEVQTSDCSIGIDGDTLRYSWSYEGKAHEGTLALRDSGAEFSDSWHQRKPIACERVADTWAIATVRYVYMESWGWQIGVCHREPTDELVVQMTNIAPWGEEGRAVRMVAKRKDAAG